MRRFLTANELFFDDAFIQRLKSLAFGYWDRKKVLLSTDDAILIEHTTKDFYWGDGGDGSGKNMLGTILMEIREKIINESK